MDDDSITSPHGLQPIMTVEETAAFLRVNVKTVYASIAAKELPGRKVGGRTVVYRDALLSFLRGHQERVLPKR
ncbi:MAG: helix-turn-helix domain-containing protein [Myxococcales bacterium]|nr:helix-turn-helix domain-containing protein [Myxococcales bacterium]